MVSVTSESEQEIIEQLLEYGTLRGYSIGAKRVTDDSDKWSWVSGESFEYTNWASGEPNNTYNKEYYACVYNVDSLFGKWNDSFNAPIEGICNGMIVEFENSILGDINNDGVVNVMDATELQKHIAGTTTLDDEALLRADVNSDGAINVNDATLIQKYSASLITEF
ncbi:MAG: dockerin type I domain-containing protein [Ruminococcus sp.]|nr:dockerin type I domain-containing protein [Ruminococcus sp.]